jgi:hypothetical protein
MVPAGEVPTLYVFPPVVIVGISVKFVLLVIVGTDNSPVNVILSPVIVPVYCGLIIVINPLYADWTNDCTYWRFAKYDKLVSETAYD